MTLNNDYPAYTAHCTRATLHQLSNKTKILFFSKAMSLRTIPCRGKEWSQIITHLGFFSLNCLSPESGILLGLCSKGKIGVRPQVTLTDHWCYSSLTDCLAFCPALAGQILTDWRKTGMCSGQVTFKAQLLELPCNQQTNPTRAAFHQQNNLPAHWKHLCSLDVHYLWVEQSTFLPSDIV